MGVNSNDAPKALPKKDMISDGLLGRVAFHALVNLKLESTAKRGAVMRPLRFRTMTSVLDAIARTWREGCHQGLWFGFA